MKFRTLILLFCMSLPGLVYAQTRDGQTPASEDICNDLKSSTPGLYGLCVAFCEAQDIGELDVNDPFLLGNKPADPKLLDLYNRKKQPNDPDMPCVKIDDPNYPDCPCWSQEELDKIFTRTALPGQRDSDQCFSISSPPAVKEIHYIVEAGGDVGSWSFGTRAYAVEHEVVGGRFVGPSCEFFDKEVLSYEPIVSVHRQMLLTEEEMAGCISEILARADAAGVDCHIVQ